MVIQLLACIGCNRIVDQWTMCKGCEDCNGKLFKVVKPTPFRKVCWFANAPKHVLKLIWADIMGNYE